MNTPHTPSSTSNRRTASRIDAVFQVRYKTLDSLVSAYTENISKGGLFIRTKTLLPVNAMVKIKLAMPCNGPEIECIGQVARTQTEDRPRKSPSGMAIVFRDMSTEHRLFIEDYIAGLSTQQIRHETDTSRPSLSILLVDDDKTVLKKARIALEAAGHTVRVAEDGLKGMAMCLQQPPDLVLSDVQMPRMDGWNLLKTIRARSSLAATMVILQTSLCDEKDRLRGYQLGVDDYLSKPYSKRELIARIDRLVESTRRNISTVTRGKSLRGDLEHVSIPTVLSMLEMERKTGVMVIVGPDICRLYIGKGRPMAMEMDNQYQDLSPLQMGVELITWNTGQFEFSPQDVPPIDNIKMSMQGFLMEITRILDEGNNTRTGHR